MGNAEHIGVKRDRLRGIGDAEVRNKCAGRR
jgi:hypothetical protein